MISLAVLLCCCCYIGRGRGRGSELGRGTGGGERKGDGWVQDEGGRREGGGGRTRIGEMIKGERDCVGKNDGRTGLATRSRGWQERSKSGGRERDDGRIGMEDCGREGDDEGRDEQEDGGGGSGSEQVVRSWERRAVQCGVLTFSAGIGLTRVLISSHFIHQVIMSQEGLVSLNSIESTCIDVALTG